MTARTPPPDKISETRRSTVSAASQPACLTDGAIDFSVSSSSKAKTPVAKTSMPTAITRAKVYKCSTCKKKWDERLPAKWLTCDWCDKDSCLKCFDDAFTPRVFEVLKSAALKVKCKNCREIKRVDKEIPAVGVHCLQVTNKPLQDTYAQTDDTIVAESTAQTEKSGDVDVVLCEVDVLACDMGTQTGVGEAESSDSENLTAKESEKVDSLIVQGHGDVCSNFYPFKFGDEEFSSLEQGFQYDRAVQQNNELAAKIL
jgi:hypothetical protein